MQLKCVSSAAIYDTIASESSILSKYWEILTPRFVDADVMKYYKWVLCVDESIQLPRSGHLK
jgi:hypothetical protein